MADGQVVFEITGDNKPIKQSLNDTTSAIQRESKKWDSAADQSTKSINDSFGSMFKKISAAAAGAAIGKFLVDFGKDAVAAASDLREVQNVVDVTFGSNSGKIETWARNASAQFGLTETQAKKFTSTLGAMMKSAGLAGPEIVNMSTDLAGLAADMASFYNLDFETAFQKIRSGISGETEPLKQLGVNMSVANLEAYALSKGIKKAFNDMSQGEQTMLRYQYLMKATADAQGDFARTSDGYANSMRRIDTALTSIKTSIGSMFLPIVESASTSLAGFLEKITVPKQRTVLDEFSDIDLNTSEKLQQIQEVATQASDLKQVFDQIASTNAGSAMEAIANGANVLKADSPTTWGNLLGALQKVDGLQNIFSNVSAGENVKDLAEALSGNSPDTSKAAAWQTFLDALSANADALSTLTGESAEETASWLERMATAANDINPEDADAWNALLANFVTGLPGLKDTEAGKAFFDSMAMQFLVMGTESKEAREGLMALGFSSEEIDHKQKQWLETCKQLVQTLPGLSSVINSQTGEVQGGAQAVSDYIEEWKNGQEEIIRWKDYYAKKDALMNAQNGLISYENELIRARQKERRLREAYEKEIANAGEDFLANYVDENTVRTPEMEAQYKRILSAFNEYMGADGNGGALAERKKAEKELQRQQEEYAEAIQNVTDLEAGLIETYGEASKAANQNADSTAAAAESMTLLNHAAEGTEGAMDQVKAALKNAQDAFKALNDYQEKTREETARSVGGVVKGFEALGKSSGGMWQFNTPVEEAARKMADLQTEAAKIDEKIKNPKKFNIDTKDVDKLQKQLDQINKEINSLGGDKPSVQNMTQNLNSQLAYMLEYKRMMDAARSNGVSEQILATLSDGSKESFDYLKALAEGKGDIEALNKAYQDVQNEAKGFTDELTAQKLAADTAYKDLVQTAHDAVAGLNMGQEAYDSVAATVQSIVSALGDKKSEVAKEVDGILAELARLSGASSYGAQVTSTVFFKPTFTKPQNAQSQANGLDYVPYDGYFAMLHQGERIQTAAEAELSRRYGNQAPSPDLAGAVRSGMGNMQIIWRGRVVADVLSEQQGNSFRALERSGWKS